MDYAFRVPNHGSDRMGRDGRLFEIAQWYPRMAVYDDVRGWNTDPYYGQGEFYLEYGDIDYAVTAPAGYTIAGSGVLQNPGEVLTPAQRTRLADAARSPNVIPIIAAGEDAAAPRAGTRTWRFRAQNVRDVAWAGAPDFRWDATNWNGILIQSYYELAKAGASWQRAAEWTRWSIRFYSQLVQPYPYPQATSVAGPVGGMEYPMFVMVHYGKLASDTASVFGTIDHEQGHEWFPMLVGSNERRYGWMDEGINTYINAFSQEAHDTGTTKWEQYMDDWRRAVADGTQAPLMTPADRINAGALGAMAYRKPGAVLLALRNHVVGPAVFDEALREYARRWAFKHPTPGDFFRTMENVSGKDLSWYWTAFFYSDDVLDIGDRYRVHGEHARRHARGGAAHEAHEHPVPGGDAAQAGRWLAAHGDATGGDLGGRRSLRCVDPSRESGDRCTSVARLERARFRAGERCVGRCAACERECALRDPCRGRAARALSAVDGTSPTPRQRGPDAIPGVRE